jgi:2-(3-amino-3-carboxypropyl)histidine synthase
MKNNRQRQIEKSLYKNKSNQNLKYGLILSTLGRQGSPKIMKNLIEKLDELNKQHYVVLMSEIFPSKLKMFADQIDW